MDALALGIGTELRFDLTRGFVAVVDAARFESTLRYNFRDGRSILLRPSSVSWSAQINRNYFYATAYLTVGERQAAVTLHRLLTEAPGHRVVDHISGDTMDNRLANLRICTHKQNARNMIHSRKGSSSFRGVCRRRNKWQAQLHTGHPNDRVITVGFFSTEIEAAMAWDRAAIEHFGEFARLNFPDDAERKLAKAT